MPRRESGRPAKKEKVRKEKELKDRKERAEKEKKGQLERKAREAGERKEKTNLDAMMEASFGSSNGSSSESDLGGDSADKEVKTPTKETPQIGGLERLQMEMIVRDSMRNARPKSFCNYSMGMLPYFGIMELQYHSMSGFPNCGRFAVYNVSWAQMR